MLLCILHKFLCNALSAQALATRVARNRVKILELIIQMNPKQSEDSIFEAVSNAITRVWTIEEKEFIQNDSELQNLLDQWLNKTFK